MGAQGFAVVDFGAFPGGLEATLDITGQAAILATSSVEAWLHANAGAGDFTDHSLDEHFAESGSFRVFAHTIVAGTGFSIRMLYEASLREPLAPLATNTTINPPTLVIPSVGGAAIRIYGKWNVAWVWN